MAVKQCALKIDFQQHETDNRGTPMFPCGGYITTVGDNITQHIPWHWHEEIEVLVVCSGTLKIENPEHCFYVKEGEGAFINSGVLHSAVNVGDANCIIKSFVFHPSIISGTMESVFEQRYVFPLLECAELSGIHFNKHQKWHKESIQYIFTAFEYFQNESYGYELLVREKLSHLWFLIVTNNKKVLSENREAKNLDAIRVKEMLTFIHSNYQNKIDLHSIAEAAAIGERECLRCFNKTIGVTPMKYLTKYRISVAAGLLTNSDMNVTEICRLTGFESPSYFSLNFKKMVEMTPREYRNFTDTGYNKQSEF